jgi:uncharacterized BrkB/YihY/UPF0761 family membrane protein
MKLETQNRSGIRNLHRLLIVHAFITFAAGMVLIVAPEQIPKAVDIRIDRSAYLVCYLLGSAELALAFLSYYSRRLTDLKSLRLVCVTFIVFHAATAAVEIYALLQEGSVKIWGNVALRVIIILLFWYYGIRQPTGRSHTNQNRLL